jgi:hypothetical protein
MTKGWGGCGGEQATGENEGEDQGQEQNAGVPPLRFAPVGMTIVLGGYCAT